MGSYTSFSVDGYQLLSSQSYVDAVVVTVFTEAEKSIQETRQSDSQDDSLADGDSATEDSFTEVGDAASGSIVLDRLEVMGCTLRAT